MTGGYGKIPLLDVIQLTESDGIMAETYRPDSMRDRLESVSERVTKTEGRQEGHEALCAQRYSEILKAIAALQGDISSVSRLGLVVAVLLFMLELGKATFPALFELMTKSIH